MPAVTQNVFLRRKGVHVLLFFSSRNEFGKCFLEVDVEMSSKNDLRPETL